MGKALGLEDFFDFHMKEGGEVSLLDFLIMSLIVFIFLDVFLSVGWEKVTLYSSFWGSGELLVVLLFSLWIFFMSFLNFQFYILFIFISFFACLLVLSGYSVGGGTGVVVLFKVFADLGILLFLGESIFLFDFSLGEGGTCELGEGGGSFLGSLGSKGDFLIFSLFVYCFCWMFGIWIVWAMNGTSFVSSYLHSMGFVLLGTFLFIKMFYLEGFCEKGMGKMEILFQFSFIFFSLLFLGSDSDKKGFGFFSCASVSYFFLVGMEGGSVELLLEYLLSSSIFKVFCFWILDWLLKKNVVKVEKEGGLEGIGSCFLFFISWIFYFMFLMAFWGEELEEHLSFFSLFFTNLILEVKGGLVVFFFLSLVYFTYSYFSILSSESKSLFSSVFSSKGESLFLFFIFMICVFCFISFFYIFSSNLFFHLSFFYIFLVVEGTFGVGVSIWLSLGWSEVGEEVSSKMESGMSSIFFSESSSFSGKEGILQEMSS